MIVGEECHIVSAKKNGPRGDQKYNGDFDHYDNLILLCATDHKRIDELTDIYTTEVLKLFKEVHESWVKETLERDVLVFTNDKQNIKSLARITSGKQLVDTIRDAHMYDFQHNDVNTEEEAEIIGLLFEEIRDYGDCLSDMSISEMIKIGIKFSVDIDNLQKMGFNLYALRRKMKFFNNVSKDLGLYDTVTLVIVKQDSPSIVGEFLIAKFPDKYDVKF